MQQYTAVVYSTAAVVLVASCLLTFIDPKRSFPLPGTRWVLLGAAGADADGAAVPQRATGLLRVQTPAIAHASAQKGQEPINRAAVDIM